MGKMENVVMRKTAELKPYKNNPKKHTQKQIDDLARSITEFGWQGQYIVFDRNDEIVIGTGRWMAARQLGYVEVPCQYAGDLTDEQVKQLRYIDNKLNESAWDIEALRLDEKELKFEGWNFKFELPTENDIARSVVDDTDEKETDNEKTTSTATKIKMGDMFKLGRHVLICGDAADGHTTEKVKNAVNGETWFIDPPYEKENLYEVMPKGPNGRMFVMYDHKHFMKPIIEAYNHGWTPRWEMIWNCVTSWYTPNRPLARHKTCAIFGDCEKWRFDDALIYDEKKRKAAHVRNTRGQCNYVPLNGAVHCRTVEEFENTAENDEGGYGKPLKWIAALLLGYAKGGVVDMFGGSGTVLCACEQIGMTCGTIEIDPKQCERIIERWEKLTGEKAVFMTGEE